MLSVLPHARINIFRSLDIFLLSVGFPFRLDYQLAGLGKLLAFLDHVS